MNLTMECVLAQDFQYNECALHLRELTEENKDSLGVQECIPLSGGDSKDQRQEGER